MTLPKPRRRSSRRRKYYGLKMAGFLLATFYVTMVAAGYAVEILFGATGLIPSERNAKVVEASVTLNYTTVLNIVFSHSRRCSSCASCAPEAAKCSDT